LRLSDDRHETSGGEMLIARRKAKARLDQDEQPPVLLTNIFSFTPLRSALLI
jgi:hypothetical protein